MRYRQKDGAFLFSVGELCGLALRDGDLDLRTGAGRTLDRALTGQEIHRALQSDLSPDDRAEVPVCASVRAGKYLYEISGRADLIRNAGISVVEEIKTVTPGRFGHPNARHLAQANLTAWLYLRSQNLPAVCVRLTQVRISDGEIRSTDRRYTAEELDAWGISFLQPIEPIVRIEEERQNFRLPSVRAGRFPYARVRESQDIMLKECYRDLKHGRHLFLQAPTGTGKTVSALYPAVRLIGEGVADRVFYLTAKSQTAREAYRAAADIDAAGPGLRTVMLTSREHLCLCESAKQDPVGISRHCNPECCPYAKDFYGKCRTAIPELLEEKNGYPRKTVLETAEKYGICPYEFQLELSEFCDIIIADYNYLFDPMVYLRRFFGPDAPHDRKNLFLVDEAHNLADRARSMYSTELCKSDAIRLMNLPDPELSEPMNRYLGFLDSMRKLCKDTLQRGEDGQERGYYLSSRPLGSLIETVEACLEQLEKWLRIHPGHLSEPDVCRLVKQLKRCAVIASCYDERFLTFVSVLGEEISVRLLCLDPSELLRERFRLGHAAVCFSATLTPTDYFADILGGGKDAICVSLPSPFDPTHLCVAAVTGVSTRYEDREKNVKKITSVIAATVSAKPGNYMVYFPSYVYLERVLKDFRNRYPQVEVIVQEQGMNHTGREAFLDAFRDDGRLRVGFCVLGGSFSEGVDLPGGRLIGAVIVGVGLPGLSNERNILRDFYENTRERGYDYAYTFPGMNRVLQAAGRVIRREDDRGIVVLCDDRYAEPRYATLLPNLWKPIRFAKNAKELADFAVDFWEKQKK